MLKGNKTKLPKLIVIPVAAIAIIAISGILKSTAVPVPVKIPTFDNKSAFISKDEAVAKIRSLPEVAEYLKTVPEAIVEVDDEENDSYSIHVYEIKDSHTATFNWFTVDKKTGMEEKMF